MPGRFLDLSVAVQNDIASDPPIMLPNVSYLTHRDTPEQLKAMFPGLGTDAWSWDAPFSITAKRFAESKDPSIIREGHRASMEIGYRHIEKLTNLDQLPAAGLLISCFPYKLKAASAGFVRAVAIFED